MIGEKIRELRLERGLKQEELAKILNVEQSTIARYESNSYEPTYSTLIKISEFFGVSMDFLFGLAEF